jgi:ATP-dependent Zn protease
MLITVLLATNHILAADNQGDRLTESLLGFLPILVFLGILFLIIRRQSHSPAGKLLQKERERHLQHMEKMEQLTERIAKALERKQ